MISRDEVEEMVNEMFCGWIYDKLPKKIVDLLDRLIDFQRFEEHFVSEIMMTCVDEKGVECGVYEEKILEQAGL